ncbi:hypothetical protein RCL1_006074 [Eukaryota sp. TZLM3-RCL]
MKYVVFDLNETLLDTRIIARCFTNHSMTQEDTLNRFWNKLFDRLQVLAATEEFVPFRDVVQGALKDIDEETAFSCIMKNYPKSGIFDDVSDALIELREHGISVVVATNTSPDLVDKLRQVSPLESLVDVWICVPCSKSLKPSPRSYLYLQEELKITDSSDLVFISSHFWDIFAAKKAGIPVIHLSRATISSTSGSEGVRVVSVPRMSMILPIVLQLFQDSAQLSLKSKILS